MVLVWIFGILIVAAIVVAVPFLWIWVFNTLFSLGIAYTFWTWLAAFLGTSLLASLFGSKGK